MLFNVFKLFIQMCRFKKKAFSEEIMEANVNVTGPYAAVTFSPAAPHTPLLHPLYYGLLAFTELVANHSRWIPTTLPDPASIFSGDPLCAHGALTFLGGLHARHSNQHSAQRSALPARVGSQVVCW